ncbi:hypothetical protein HPB49_007356 [Dermacentor silvarum]|uniref:Uncharacterized protein n=1 Tax=Dermacentor silvarum TaxID=543639 RepID=A0ACB8D393_DERSI|nr:hypothetical protein HPB49_007356 [Dermacentor silvarum]
MDERSPEDIQSSSATADALRSPSRQSSRKASVYGRSATDEAVTTRSWKADATGSRISLAPSERPRHGASRTGVKSRTKKQPIKKSAPAPTNPTGSGAPTSTAGLSGSGVVSSPSTATVTQKAIEDRTARTGVSGEAPQEDVAAHSASSPMSGGVRGAVDSTGVASVDASRTQATSIRHSTQPEGVVTTGTESSGPSSPAGACDRVVSSGGSGASVASPGGRRISLPLSPTAKGHPLRRLSFFSSPGTAGSSMADVSAPKQLHRRPTATFTSSSHSGQFGVRQEVNVPPNPESFKRKLSEQRLPCKPNVASMAVGKAQQMYIHRPDQAVDKSRRLFLVLLGVSFVVLIIVASIAYLVMPRQRVNGKTTNQSFCFSGGCVEHADIIGLSDVSKGAHESSPCENFGHFVCSIWEARHKENIVHKRFTQSVVLDAVMDLIVSLEKFSGQRHALAISQRPARMMDACLTDRPSDDEMALNQLLDFMRNTSFGFPDEDVDVSNYSRPLHALTELAYNWALPLWFFADLVMPRNSTAAHIIISLSHSSLGDLYNSLHEALMVYEDVYLCAEQNFIQLWLSRAASYQQSWASVDERSSDASLFRMDTSLVASHHIVLKTVSLSLALLKAPFYYPDATSAIIYGGVGFIYATELVKVLNSLSLLLDGRNSIVPSENGFSQAYVSAPYSCSGMADNDIFPRYIGLELAYATYRQFRSDDEDMPLWNAKEYSPEQVFFATVCYLMCDMERGADACTLQMKRFREFATAFSCPPGFAKEPCEILH